MNTRPTLRQIAELANVHHTTVSRALRNDRRIPLATKERILEIAKKIGYSPDPMLSALAFYRNSQATKNVYRATLGWITNFPTRNGWKAYERLAYYRGANQRAQELGYNIEEFWLRDSGMTETRATSILAAKNIQGLIFIPQPRARAHLKSIWTKFPAVTFGHTLFYPAFHNVDNDHFRSFAHLMRQIKKHGYRKPGFAIARRVDESNDRAWSAAFGAYQVLPPQKQIPILTGSLTNPSEFKKWLLKYEPDVVIADQEIVLQWMTQLKIRVPDDVGFVLAAKYEGAPENCSGMDENNEIVGQVAVDILAKMINNGDVGTPLASISTLIEGKWVEGSTIKNIAPKL